MLAVNDSLMTGVMTVMKRMIAPPTRESLGAKVLEAAIRVDEEDGEEEEEEQRDEA